MKIRDARRSRGRKAGPRDGRGRSADPPLDDVRARPGGARRRSGTCTSARATRRSRASRKRSRRSKAERRRSASVRPGGGGGVPAGAAGRGARGLPRGRVLRRARDRAASSCRAGGWRPRPSTWRISTRCAPRCGRRRALIWAETPSNPLMQIADLAALAEIAHGAGRAARRWTARSRRRCSSGRSSSARTPSIHSTTKYLGGHSDVQGGALVFRQAGELSEQVEHIRKILGRASPRPSTRGSCCAACARSPAAIERHCSNALAVARFLAAHPAVEVVHYPGLESHPGHAIAKRQMSGLRRDALASACAAAGTPRSARPRACGSSSTRRASAAPRA